MIDELLPATAFDQIMVNCLAHIIYQLLVIYTKKSYFQNIFMLTEFLHHHRSPSSGLGCCMVYDYSSSALDFHRLFLTINLHKNWSRCEEN